MVTMTTTTVETVEPVFELAAGEHVDHILELLSTQPPSAADILAEHPPVTPHGHMPEIEDEDG